MNLFSKYHLSIPDTIKWKQIDTIKIFYGKQQDISTSIKHTTYDAYIHIMLNENLLIPRHCDRVTDKCMEYITQKRKWIILRFWIPILMYLLLRSTLNFDFFPMKVSFILKVTWKAAMLTNAALLF